MQYLTITPPLFRRHRDMTRKEAITYFEWFVAQIPERIAVLEQAVRSTSITQYQMWVANRSPDSLATLCKWLAEHISVMPPDEKYREQYLKDLENIPAQHRAIFSGVPGYVFTDETYSLVIDVGMYLGEVLRKRFPYLEWHLCTQPKRHIDYHEPVLVGFIKVARCNPVSLARSAAGDLVKNRSQSSCLRDAFETIVYVETEY